MHLVILAAGHGRRFGGLKQLAPVGPNGEAIMDYTVATAQSCGYEGVVLVVRDEIYDEVREHAARRFPADFPVTYAFQARRPGTASALASVAGVIDGPFAVANADDHYGADAIASLRTHFRPGAPCGPVIAGRHALVGYELARTVLADGRVTRGLIEVDDDGRLTRIVEHSVVRRHDGRFLGRPLPDTRPGASVPPVATAERELTAEQPVSMNLWGFHHRILDEIARAIDEFDPAAALRHELLIPDVVGALIASGSDEVQVHTTPARCLGITNPEDLDLMREALAGEPPPGDAPVVH